MLLILFTIAAPIYGASGFAITYGEATNANSQWKNSVYSNKILAKKIPMSVEKFEKLLIEFCNTQKDIGKVPENDADYRSHFINWLDIQSAKRENQDKKKPKLAI